MSHKKRKQATKVPKNKYHGLFNVNTAEETKAKAHVYRQRQISSTHVGPELFPASHAQWTFWLFPDPMAFPSPALSP